MIFVNRFFYPDISATSQMLSDLAFALSNTGRQVEVVTSQMRYDAPDVQLPAIETVNDVAIHRMRTSRLGRGRVLFRLIDYLSFHVAVLLFLARHVKRSDIVIIKTDPPLLSVPIGWLLRMRKVDTISWLQDVFPEVMQASGLQIGPNWLNSTLQRGMLALRDSSLKHAAANVVISRGMQKFILERGIPVSKITTIPNWARTDQITPVDPMDNPLRKRWGVQHRFVVGYSGNMGVAHEFDTMLEAAKRLRDEPNICFVLTGAGKHSDQLKTAVSTAGLDEQVQFQPYQPMSDLSNSLGVADVHLVSLRPEMEGLIVPSKTYGIAAAARPVIFIGAADGDIAQLVYDQGVGVQVDCGDATGLAAAIKAYSVDAERCKREGMLARQLALTSHSLENALIAWQCLLQQVDAEKTA